MAAKPRFDGEWVRLDEVACINPRQPKELSNDDKVSFLPLAEVNTDGTTNLGIDSVRLEVSKGHPWFVDGDLLIAKITPSFENGKIALATTTCGEGYTSTEFHIVRPNNELIVREFLLAYLRSRKVKCQCAARMKGSAGQKRVPAEVLRRLQIPAFSLETQKGIASQFEGITCQLGDCESQIVKLDALVKSRFVEMFGDPAINEFDFPSEKLGDLGTLERGRSKHRPRNAPELRGGPDGPYPLIQTGDIANAGSYLTTYEDTYTELGLQQSRMWPKGTLCITIAANIAQTSILAIDACFPDSVVGFTANGKTVNLFMHYWFSFFQNILEEQAPQAAQKNINLRTLQNLDVIVPPLSLQQEFASFVAEVDKSRFCEMRFPGAI